MKAAEFARWVEQCRELEATHVEVRRARKGGGVNASIFARERIEDVDAERLVERMRDDMASSHRRLSRSTFEVLALRVEGSGKDAERVEVMRDVVVIERDEVAGDGTSADAMTLEGASVEGSRVAWAAAREAHRDLRDMAKDVCGTLQSIAEQLSNKLVEANEKQASTLATAFEFATLRHEREEADRASSERRELGRVALQELGPIVGAGLAHITKNATPAWASFAKRIQENGKVDQILALLDSDEVAALGAALGHTFPPKASDTKEESNAQEPG